MSNSDHPHEIFIIKRQSGGHDDSHHGGVWKIAFADFMTAMMAFFLVMWLISANEKTKAAVASYFNPLKLVESTPRSRGLEDVKKGDARTTSALLPDKGSQGPDGSANETDKKPPAGAAQAAHDSSVETRGTEAGLASALSEDPYGTLDRIAGSKATDHRTSPAAQAPELKEQPELHKSAGGDAFRDPFAPLASLEAEVPKTQISQLASVGTLEAKKASPTPVSAPEVRPDAAKNSPAAVNNERRADESELTRRSVTNQSANAGENLAQQSSRKNSPDSGAERLDIKAQIISAAKTSPTDKQGPQVEVRKTDEGLLISLTDSADFSMFTSGSAVPSRKVVLLMERVAQVLKTKSGPVIVRGFTDARPFKAGRYDNWQLSLDRAQVTHYMLVRGGLDETRVARIEGLADRNQKDAKDPMNPVNRRIEILLQSAKP